MNFVHNLIKTQSGVNKIEKNVDSQLFQIFTGGNLNNFLLGITDNFFQIFFLSYNTGGPEVD